MCVFLFACVTIERERERQTDRQTELYLIRAMLLNETHARTHTCECNYICGILYNYQRERLTERVDEREMFWMTVVMSC